MSSKRPLAIAIGVLLIAAIGVAVYWARSSRPPPPSRRADQPGAIGGGVPVQQQRIDDYIARVGKEDLETLVENLNRHEDLLVSVGAGSSGATERNMFAVCLANRRLAKIFAELESRPAEEADRLCRNVFEEKFNTQKTAILEVREIWGQGARPTEPRPFDENRIALHGAVFLSAAFCPMSEVLRQLEEWEELGRSTQERIAGINDPKESFLARISLDQYAFPESVFQLNLYSWMLRDRCGDSDFEQLLPKGLPTERIAFCTWDAHTNPFDFTHQEGGVLADKKSVLRELTFHSRWDRWPQAVKERNRKLLSSLRQRLEKHAADDAN